MAASMLNGNGYYKFGSKTERYEFECKFEGWSCFCIGGGMGMRNRTLSLCLYLGPVMIYARRNARIVLRNRAGHYV